ncbi:hypothetical protein [Yoonia sp. SDW83-1]|uniref:hypothetical protein n=1 Tax=Yoonia sp. SDW83-1 TaxID=3366945 RepID=UPI00398C2D27
MKLLSCAAFALTLSTTSALAIDPCLVGQWEVDGQSLADAMGAQMGGSARHDGGSANLQISDAGDMSMTIDDLVITAQMPDVPPMAITISGASQGTLSADDNDYIADVTDYALVGSADVMGTRMDIPITTADGGGWGQSRGNFRCSDDVLTFVPDAPGSIPPSWTRVR